MVLRYVGFARRVGSCLPDQFHSISSHFPGQVHAPTLSLNFRLSAALIAFSSTSSALIWFGWRVCESEPRDCPPTHHAPRTHTYLPLCLGKHQVGLHERP